jgi:hypothetical protein
LSPRRDRTVRELVEKYRKKCPDLERPLLRYLIRRSNIEIFPPESSKLKTLDRELKKSFSAHEEYDEASFNQRVKTLIQKYKDKIVLSNRFSLLEPQEAEGHTTFIRKDVPYAIGPFEKKSSEIELKEINELRDFLDNDKSLKESFEAYRKLAGEVNRRNKK